MVHRSSTALLNLIVMPPMQLRFLKWLALLPRA
jgi:hypothetical protein